MPVSLKNLQRDRDRRTETFHEVHERFPPLLHEKIQETLWIFSSLQFNYFESCKAMHNLKSHSQGSWGLLLFQRPIVDITQTLIQQCEPDLFHFLFPSNLSLSLLTLRLSVIMTTYLSCKLVPELCLPFVSFLPFCKRISKNMIKNTIRPPVKAAVQYCGKRAYGCHGTSEIFQLVCDKQLSSDLSNGFEMFLKCCKCILRLGGEIRR